MVLNKMSKVDELQMRSQILHMILANSSLLAAKMNEYKQKNGPYFDYYKILASNSTKDCEQLIDQIYITSCPTEVLAEMRELLTALQPCKLILDRKSQLIDKELRLIIQNARAILGQARNRCC